jgi:hypothetical protein
VRREDIATEDDMESAVQDDNNSHNKQYCRL